MARLRSLLVLMLLVPLVALAQPRKLKNQPKYDNRWIHFGFFIGLNSYDFLVQQKDPIPIGNFYSVQTIKHPGYSIAILTDVRISEYFTLRFSPTFSATKRDLLFDIENPFIGLRQEILKEMESSFIEFPFHLKFRSQRINNYRLFVFTGPNFMVDLASKEDVEDDQVFKLKRNDLAVEVGFGMDFYLEFFKFSPQIKAGWGTRNLLVDDGTPFVEALDKLQSRYILFCLTFE
jgi:hypothetical protein